MLAHSFLLFLCFFLSCLLYLSVFLCMCFSYTTRVKKNCGLKARSRPGPKFSYDDHVTRLRPSLRPKLRPKFLAKLKVRVWPWGSEARLNPVLKYACWYMAIGWDNPLSSETFFSAAINQSINKSTQFMDWSSEWTTAWAEERFCSRRGQGLITQNI